MSGPLDDFFKVGIEKGLIQALPRSGQCMFCKKSLVGQKDHSVCDACWDDTFMHKFRPDEDSFCVDCGSDENDENHLNWIKKHGQDDPLAEPAWIDESREIEPPEWYG